MERYKYPGFEVVLFGEYSDPKSKAEITATNFLAQQYWRKTIIEKYASPYPDWFRYGVDLAQRSIVRRFTEAGIPDEAYRDLLTPPALIQKRHIRKMVKELGDSDLRLGSSILGDAEFINGVGRVYYHSMDSKLEWIGTAFHEMYHYCRLNLIASFKGGFSICRSGLVVSRLADQGNVWFPEEALVTYETALFVEEISQDPLYQQSVESRQKALAILKRKGHIDDQGRVTYAPNRTIEPRFIFYYPFLGITVYSLNQPATSALSGSLTEALLSPFADTERMEVLRVWRLARFEPRFTRQLAQLIDSKWGRGTYVKLTHLPRRFGREAEVENTLWNVVQEMREKAQTGQKF